MEIKKTRITLWKVAIGNWGWESPKTIYCPSKKAAQELYDSYPAAGKVRFAGEFTPSNAMILLDNYWHYVPDPLPFCE